jgi:hypothetical protein
LGELGGRAAKKSQHTNIFIERGNNDQNTKNMARKVGNKARAQGS